MLLFISNVQHLRWDLSENAFAEEDYRLFLRPHQGYPLSKTALTPVLNASRLEN